MPSEVVDNALKEGSHRLYHVSDSGNCDTVMQRASITKCVA